MYAVVSTRNGRILSWPVLGYHSLALRGIPGRLSDMTPCDSVCMPPRGPCRRAAALGLPTFSQHNPTFLQCNGRLSARKVRTAAFNPRGAGGCVPRWVGHEIAWEQHGMRGLGTHSGPGALNQQVGRITSFDVRSYGMGRLPIALAVLIRKVLIEH